MKKLFLLILFIVVLTFTSCVTLKDKSFLKEGDSDDCPELIGIEWCRDFSSCIEYLAFGEDGHFSYYCACGSPVGFSDLGESYVYRDSDKKVFVLDSNEKVIDKAEIIYTDGSFLVIRIFGEIVVFLNDLKDLPIPNEDVLEYIDDPNLVVPIVWLDSYKKGSITVNSYDSHEKDGRTLELSDDVSFLRIDSGVREELKEKDVEALSKEGAMCCLTFNWMGEVQDVIFTDSFDYERYIDEE